MKVNSINNRDISFNGFYNSGFVKKGLEFAANNGALFAATTTLCLSVIARPLAIFAAPKTDKENKKNACAKSISSSVSGYFLMLALSLPVAKSIKKINSKPAEYLEEETINKLKDGCESLFESKAYILATQIFKLGIGLLAACPKAVLTALGMPYVIEYLFHEPLPDKQKSDGDEKNNLSFKGKGEDKLTKGISKILDKRKFQEFAEKYKDSNFPMHIVAATDALTTGTFIHQTMKSKKIEEKRKLALSYNAFISTGLSICTSYIVDKIMEKPTEKFISKFKEANKNSPKLDKYMEGIKISKPILIVGCVYYIFIPFVSTFLADRAEKEHKLLFRHGAK